VVAPIVEPWIVDARLRQLAADRYGPLNHPERVEPIEALIWHYTGPGSFAGARTWLTAKDATPVSAHFLIDRDGTAWQLVPLTERAIHAGGTTSTLYGRGNVNGRTIGIELANVGPLKPTDSAGWTDAMGRPYAGPVGKAPIDGSAWEPFPGPQIDAACALARKLAELFPQLGAEPEKRNLGHRHVDPSRKLDPGPLFPWALIFGACRAVGAVRLRNG
jgi:N-acetyl-anhydromuramyl-L-alanine amidase AmpD